MGSRASINADNQRRVAADRNEGAMAADEQRRLGRKIREECKCMQRPAASVGRNELNHRGARAWRLEKESMIWMRRHDFKMRRGGFVSRFIGARTCARQLVTKIAISAECVSTRKAITSPNIFIKQFDKCK